MGNKYPNMNDSNDKSNKPSYIPRYKSKLPVYLVICGLLYIVFNSFKAVITVNYPLYSPWIRGLYFFASLMVMVIAYYKIARRGDNYIKQFHNDLYDRYYNVLVTGKKEVKRPIFIGLQTMMNTDYENDVNLKTIRKEAKLYACSLAIIVILTFITAFG